MKDVVIFGAGDQAQVAHVMLTEDSPYRVAAFTVNQAYIKPGDTLFEKPVVPFEEIERSHPPERFAMLVSVGFKRVNELRSEIYAQCKQKGYELISYVSSRAIRVGPVEVGDNCFILEANVLQPFVRIGNNVVLWSGNHVGHHVRIEDDVFVASHAVISGKVVIGRGCFVGVNATFRDGVRVAPRCVIGAGATVLRDTSEGEVIVGARTEADARKSWDLKSFQ
jgi:sugar O-acyltransferase (sialic acid O-acetyltransferase NeuD family)